MGSINYGQLKALPAERKRGLIFSERFGSEAEVAENGGKVTGTPVFYDGVALNGITDYITYPTTNLNNFNAVTCITTFIPYFAKNDNVARMIFDSETTNRFYIFRNTTSDLVFSLGNVYYEVTYSNYSVYWNDFAKNNISFAMSDEGSYIYLNGNLIQTILLPVWDKNFPVELIIGARISTFTLKFKGIINNFKIFKKALSAEEILAYSQNKMWSYFENCQLALPMLNDTHDITNAKVIDRSGKGNDVTLGDGSTASTFPTYSKGAYTFDGSNDYFSNMPSVSGKYPYMFIKTGSSPELSTSSVIYGNIGTSGAFTGKVYSIFLFDEELNEMQVADLELQMRNIYHRGK